MQTVVTEEQVNVFSEYPPEMEKFFSEKEVVLKLIPTELVQIGEEISELRISTIKEFYDYLNK